MTRDPPHVPTGRQSIGSRARCSCVSRHLHLCHTALALVSHGTCACDTRYLHLCHATCVTRLVSHTVSRLQVGTFADNILADAIVKGIPGFNVTLAYEAITQVRQTATTSLVYPASTLLCLLCLSLSHLTSLSPFSTLSFPPTLTFHAFLSHAFESLAATVVIVPRLPQPSVHAACNQSCT